MDGHGHERSECTGERAKRVNGQDRVRASERKKRNTNGVSEKGRGREIRKGRGIKEIYGEERKGNIRRGMKYKGDIRGRVKYKGNIKEI